MATGLFDEELAAGRVTFEDVGITEKQYQIAKRELARFRITEFFKKRSVGIGTILPEDLMALRILMQEYKFSPDEFGDIEVGAYNDLLGGLDKSQPLN